MFDGGLGCRFVPHSQLWARYFAIPGNNLMIGIPGKDRSYSDEGAQLAAYIIQNVTGAAILIPRTSAAPAWVQLRWVTISTTEGCRTLNCHNAWSVSERQNFHSR